MTNTPAVPNEAPTADQFGRELAQYALELGAEIYGVASAEQYEREFAEKPKPSKFVEGARSVIVVGLPFEPGTVSTVLSPELSGLRVKASDELTSGRAQPQGAEQFFLGEENRMLNQELSWIGYNVAKLLRRRGWKALYLPVTKQDTRFRTAPFYHMPAMYLAGLGTLGLNCSILTPEFGPRLKVTTIITDCPITPGSPLDNDLCTRCGLCVDNCPIHAIDGEGWKNPYACASYGCCGTCIAICPVGEV